MDKFAHPLLYGRLRNPPLPIPTSFSNRYPPYTQMTKQNQVVDLMPVLDDLAISKVGKAAAIDFDIFAGRGRYILVWTRTADYCQG
jgi:hypothetical protein